MFAKKAKCYIQYTKCSCCIGIGIQRPPKAHRQVGSVSGTRFKKNLTTNRNHISIPLRFVRRLFLKRGPVPCESARSHASCPRRGILLR